MWASSRSALPKILILMSIAQGRSGDIYISPGYWRKGIGKGLVEEAERILRSRRYEDVILWVLEGNQQARWFYEAMGFCLDGESKIIDWGTPLKAVRLEKPYSLLSKSKL